MTVWTDEVEVAVHQALEEVRSAEPDRKHLGRPFMTAYQLAIKVERIYPS